MTALLGCDFTSAPSRRKPIILAGGLSVTNVGDAIRRVHPYAVDVSGGVEQSKGVKDQVKIREFIAEVNSVGTIEKH